jgi:hypothetical protein
VKSAVPVVLGVPVIAPPEERLKPVGSSPELTVQEYGVVPPDALRVAE